MRNYQGIQRQAGDGYSQKEARYLNDKVGLAGSIASYCVDSDQNEQILPFFETKAYSMVFGARESKKLRRGLAINGYSYLVRSKNKIDREERCVA